MTYFICVQQLRCFSQFPTSVLAPLRWQCGAMTRQGMGTEGKPSECCSHGSHQAVCQGCVQQGCLLSPSDSGCASVDSSRSRGRGKHAQAVRNGVGRSPCAGGAVLWIPSLRKLTPPHDEPALEETKRLQFFRVSPSDQRNRSGHKKHSICRETCPAH